MHTREGQRVCDRKIHIFCFDEVLPFLSTLRTNGCQIRVWTHRQAIVWDPQALKRSAPPELSLWNICCWNLFHPLKTKIWMKWIEGGGTVLWPTQTISADRYVYCYRYIGHNNNNSTWTAVSLFKNNIKLETSNCDSFKSDNNRSSLKVKGGQRKEHVTLHVVRPRGLLCDDFSYDLSSQQTTRRRWANVSWTQAVLPCRNANSDTIWYC